MARDENSECGIRINQGNSEAGSVADVVENGICAAAPGARAFRPGDIVDVFDPEKEGKPLIIQNACVTHAGVEGGITGKPAVRLGGWSGVFYVDNLELVSRAEHWAAGGICPLCGK